VCNGLKMNFLNYKVLDLSVKTYLKRCAAAAVAGYGCKQCINDYRNHPENVVRHIKYSLVGGAAGGLRGCLMGLWTGPGVAFPLFLSQTMVASFFTFGFFSIRSSLSNMNVTLPKRDRPINGFLVTTLAGGITGSVISTMSGINGRRMVVSFSLGLLVGIVGHLVFEQAKIWRLEMVLKQNYPELMAELKEAEKYMDQQSYENPYYTGPVRPTPWSSYARGLLRDFHDVKEKMLDDNYKEISS